MRCMSPGAARLAASFPCGVFVCGVCVCGVRVCDMRTLVVACRLSGRRVREQCRLRGRIRGSSRCCRAFWRMTFGVRHSASNFQHRICGAGRVARDMRRPASVARHDGIARAMRNVCRAVRGSVMRRDDRATADHFGLRARQRRRDKRLGTSDARTSDARTSSSRKTIPAPATQRQRHFEKQKATRKQKRDSPASAGLSRCHCR